MKKLLLFPLLIAIVQLGFAQGPPAQANLQTDPSVRTGVLPNGMTYFVKHNEEPANRAELRLAVKVGSVLEDDDQQGLAHFVEHMAFNGSAHFKKSELVDALEGMGVKFGPHLNAYTSFDETVYMLQVPTDQQVLLDKAMLVLEDWACALSFENEEIDKERGVVIEEWRLRSGAMTRMMQELMPVMVNGSKYADRLPIGKPEILKNFKYETLKRYYKTWYRPDLMAVMVVGDVDVDKVEADLKARFSKIPAQPNAKPRPVIEIPAHADIKAKVIRDKETQFNLMQILFKHDNLNYNTLADFRESLLRQLVGGMISDRIEELKQKGDSPIIFGGVYDGPVQGLRSRSAFNALAIFNPTGADKALQMMLTELERARRHGFIASEFERQKTKMLKDFENAFNERSKTGSDMLVMEMVEIFLMDGVFVGAEQDLKLAKEMLPDISLEEANARAKELITDRDAVIVVAGLDKPEVVLPTEEAILKTFEAVRKEAIEPYTEQIDDRPLIDKQPNPGKVVSSSEMGYGITEYKLSNGVRVWIKSTDFKDDEIQMNAWSPGGSSRFDDDLFKSGWAAAQLFGMSGVGQFKDGVLQKKLAGKNVMVMPQILEHSEGFYGMSGKADFETMLQLTYLYCTAPRIDKEAFSTFKELQNTMIGMRNGPEGLFRDSIQAIVNGHHPRKMPITPDQVDKMNLTQAYMAYNERFMDASDFTFCFIGNIDKAAAMPLIEKYIGGLPNLGRKESWKEYKLNAPTGVVKKEVRSGSDPKSMVNLHFYGTMNYSVKEVHDMNAMLSVLRIMMRESMREEKGGVYGVGASLRLPPIPSDKWAIDISFGCDPNRVDELIATVFDEIHKLQAEGASEKNLAKIKEIEKRERETDLMSNDWWLQLLESYDTKKVPLSSLDEYGNWVEGLNGKMLGDIAKKYISDERYVQVILYPEK